MARHIRYPYSRSAAVVLWLALAAVVLWLLAVALAAQGPGAPTGVAVTARAATPTITSLSVSSGLVGDAVTITGSGFGAVQGSGSVTFNGTAATVTSWSALSLVTTVPTGATTGNIVVTAASGLSSVGTAFTVTTGGAGPIAAARLAGGSATVPNPTWSAVGATIEASSSRATCATLASTSTVAQINSAISSCAAAHPLPGAGGVVALGAGTFSITNTMFGASNVTLRGAGAGTGGTVLTITGTNSGDTWPWRAGVTGNGGLIIVSGGCCLGSDSSPTTSGVRSGNTRTWSGTGGSSGVYTQGATVLNLATTPTGLAVGDEIVMWQDNETIAPNGNLWFSLVTSSSTAPPAGTVWQGSTYGDFGALEQRAEVTAVNGTAVTISPGLLFSTGHFKTRLNPRVGWLAQADLVRKFGIENLRINALAAHVPSNCVVCFGLVKDSWLTGLVIQPRVGSGIDQHNSHDYVIKVLDSLSVTVRDNWITKAVGGGNFTSTTYSISTSSSQNLLVQNNILDDAQQALTLEVASHGNVYAYNYDRFVSGEGGVEHHEVGSSYNLLEGNEFYKATSDLFHGNTNVETFFRNHFSARGVDAWSYHRWYNIVGNTFSQVNDGAGNGLIYKTLNTDATKYNRWSGYALRLGYPGQNPDVITQCNGIPSGGCVIQDSVVWQSAMIWGNFATTGGTHFDSSDVPSSDAVLPNPVPANNNLPSSYYLSSKPAWFGSAPFPLNGPDVTGGDVTGMSGHTNKSPARRCYEAAGGNIANFTVANCPYLGL